MNLKKREKHPLVNSYRLKINIKGELTETEINI